MPVATVTGMSRAVGFADSSGSRFALFHVDMTRGNTVDNHRNVPSRDDTLQVIKRLEQLADEMRELSERLSRLSQRESEPRKQQRRATPSRG